MFGPPTVTMFVDAIIELCEEEMPRTCANCKKKFSSFKEYVEGTEPIGVPQDCESLGKGSSAILSYENCACGGTMVFKCSYLTPQLQEMFMNAVRMQAEYEGKSEEIILSELRTAVRQKVLQGEVTKALPLD